MSLGLSWAHVLGDAFSASDFINRWAQVVGVIQSTGPPKTTPTPNRMLENSINPSPSPTKDFPLSLKRVDPVGDHWITPNDTKMETISFPISRAQIANLKSQIPGPFFESLSAIVWKSIAKIREQSEPKAVTVFKNNPKRAKGELTNSQIISSVQADFSVVEADPRRLASLLAEEAIEETTQIEESVENDQGLSDFVVYGANLSFVDWQEADFYGLELQGQRPDFVSYGIQGVGDNGVVLVLPGPKCSGKVEGRGGEGRLVTMILPENEVSELKSELKKSGLLLEEENIE
ncbi:Transferase [Parasponia andersonii]|uniref:Transferase n=1 Tax=Parasponia andersonii TaxID=3476 RepID=A0A2P5C3M8_PARAD|nr:Transferase [Parasponia andersonii]